VSHTSSVGGEGDQVAPAPQVRRGKLREQEHGSRLSSGLGTCWTTWGWELHLGRGMEESQHSEEVLDRLRTHSKRPWGPHECGEWDSPGEHSHTVSNKPRTLRDSFLPGTCSIETKVEDPR
jgi:hypothetical protein